MGFLGAQPLLISYGDIVIVYINPNDMKAVVLSPAPAANYSNKHGKFLHAEMVGKPYGSKIASVTKSGFLFVLHPTPELWTLVLNHRTQILYQADISLISTMLELVPGCDMLEAGTGSGSFSHSIARSIAPTGKLYSFEYHKERQLVAAAEFVEHGLTNIVSQHRDVCKESFGLVDAVTAIFLDVPSPWEAIAHPDFKSAFKTDRIGRICSFSPCVEQVILTCRALKDAGFVDIKMYEVLMRAHDVKVLDVPALPRSKDHKKPEKRKWNDYETGIITSKVQTQVRGHTSYLTFGTLLPAFEGDAE